MTREAYHWSDGGSYTMYTSVESMNLIQQHTHELEVIKDTLTAMMNRLDRNSAILEELADQVDCLYIEVSDDDDSTSP